MKVIRVGTTKNYEVTCYRCDSDIVFKLSEAFLFTPMWRSIDNKRIVNGVTTLHIQCPECGHYIDTGMR